MQARTRTGALLLAGALAATGCTAAAPAVAAQHRTVTCGYWVDGNNFPNDGALSARPGHTPANNELAHVEGTGAWQVCYDTGNLTFYLKADIGACLGINSGQAAWQNCDTVQSQEWTLGSKDPLTGKRRVHNRAAGGVLCAEGPPPSNILSNAASIGCSNNHMMWGWASQPQVRG
jgi:hypothetical protein